MADAIHLWLWTITDPRTGRRVRLGWRMTEETAQERYGDDAERIEASLEIRTLHGHTSAFRPHDVA